MILLDTNQLEHVRPPDGTLLAMLQTLARESGHGLGLPEIAYEEHVTHYRLALEAAWRKHRAAAAELRRYARSAAVRDADLDVDAAVGDHAERLQSVFQIARAPDWASRESLLREARRQPPAKVSADGPGAGARDAAIWLTAIAVCRDTEESVYFVSADGAAFGRDLKPELAADRDALLGDRAGAFHYFNTIDALLGELAAMADESPDRDMIADSEHVRAAMKALLEDPILAFELAAGAELAESGALTTDPESLELISAGGPNVSYQIGSTMWACARPTWRARMSFERIFYGPDGMHIDPPLNMTFKVTTTLVLQLGSDGAISSAEMSARSRAFGFEL